MDRVCRICMSGAGDQLDIFVSHAESPSLEEMINECVDVKIKCDDQYPKQICEICLGDVHCAYRFKKNYQLTLEQLKHCRHPLNTSKENTLLDATEEGNETLMSVKNSELKLNEKEVKHACVICGKEFPKKVGLSTHMHKMHSEHIDRNMRAVKCPNCHKYFASKHNLKRHLIRQVCTKESMGPSEKENILTS